MVSVLDPLNFSIILKLRMGQYFLDFLQKNVIPEYSLQAQPENILTDSTRQTAAKEVDNLTIPAFHGLAFCLF